MIWAYSGFLGGAKDWEPLARELHDLEVRAPDLATLYRSAPDLPSAARLQHASAAAGDVLVGYSLGARLALHQLLEGPDHYAGAVIVSANPGLESPDARVGRVAADRVWRERFGRGDATVLTDWNAQPVFRGEPARERPTPERSGDTRAWAETLDGWGLGRQEPLWSRLNEIQVPMVWIVGAEDLRYVAMAHRAATLNSRIRVVEIERCAHRVLFEAPDRFADVTGAFIRGLFQARTAP